MTGTGAPAADSARFRLRAATAADHTRVDRLFAPVDLGRRDGYGRFLQAQAAAHLPVEAALTQAGAATLLPDWPQRCRADLLVADLRALDLPAPQGGAMPVFEGSAAMLGAIYVLEGSRLGGRLLRRGVPAHLPSSFLGADRPSGWRDLVKVLDTRLVDRRDLALATTAATAVFALFAACAVRFLGEE